MRKSEFRKLYQVRALTPGQHKRRDHANKHHGAAHKRVERQLHRAVLAAGRAPDRNDEVLQDYGYLVEDKQQEHVEAQENPVYSANERQVEGEEFIGPRFDVLRKEN